MLADNSLLLPPTSQWSRLGLSGTVRFDELKAKPCLILLGEPGMGKSTALEDEILELTRSAASTGEIVHHLDLKAYGSEDRLVRNLFEDPIITGWLKGEHVLHLVLDSLDEGLLHIKPVADLLLAELQRVKQHIPRLRFRIACRTAEWPANLESGLAALWGEHSVGAYELAPLMRQDVEVAAKAYGIDVDGFWGELRRVSAEPLASKPITLRFLLNTFRRDGRLPATQNQLYLEGCRLLCEENSDSRRGAGILGRLSADQRLAVACRIAAVMVFCNKAAVYTGVGDAPLPDAELELRELVGSTEPVGTDLQVVDEAAVREALGTGLFSSRGQQRQGWAHQTYAEFLAARYLVVREMKPSQMLSLVMHGEHDDQVVPQLYEPAAWLAGMSSPVLDAIMRGDPQVLLRSDIASAAPETRSKIVDSLLRLFAAGELLDNNFALRSTYGRLRHPGLHDQLEPRLRNRDLNVIARRFAIDLAAACEVSSLQGVLADIVLEENETMHIRAQAAHAVVAIGDSVTKSRLRPLIDGRAGPDPDDELKGCGLRALWPKQLSADELFPLLTSQKRPNLYGAYAGFLSRNLMEHLAPAGLPAALKWVRLRPVRYDPFDQLGKLVDEILAYAWEHLDVPIVFDQFLPLVLTRLKEHEGVTRSSWDAREESLWSQDDPRRLRLVEALVPEVSAEGIEPGTLVFGPTPLVWGSDIPWMVDRIRACPSATERPVWATLIRVAFFAGDFPHVDLLIQAVANVPELAAQLGSFFEPVDIDSEHADAARKSLLEQKSWKRPEPILLDPPPQDRVRRVLQQCESGQPKVWWTLNQELTLEPRSTVYGSPFEADLTELPGWKAADPPMRQRIVSTAREYLIAAAPHPEEWLGKDVLDYRAAAGYRALLLLRNQDPAAFLGLPRQVWVTWTPIVLAFWTQSEEAIEAQADLVEVAYKNAPEAVVRILLQLIDIENTKGDYLPILRVVQGCWDGRLKLTLSKKTQDPALRPGCLRELLDELLQHEVEEARSYAASLVPLPPPSDGLERERSLQAAQALLSHAPDAGWDVVWPAMCGDQNWGEQLVLSLAHRHDRRGLTITAKLTESQVAEFYRWLAMRFPPSRDPEEPSGVHEVTPKRAVVYFRDNVLAALQQRGTPASVQEIARLARELPELSFLKWTLVTAKEVMLQRTWTPPRPAQILQLARDPVGRLVNSGEQLLAVVIESLERWEQKLQGTPPASFRLWDERAKNKRRPKNEDKLSDDAAIHLKEELVERGVVVNREVVIRRGEKPGGRGERTDIHVNAVRRGDCPDSFDTITVIIESKGCWNDELDTAMRSQLRDRYMNDSPCRHGLYLVGWFVCPQWDPDDPRQHAVPNMNLIEAREYFETQARDLSMGGKVLQAFVANTALR